MPKEKSLELVRIPLSQIKPDPKNAKDHDVGLIIESFRRFGYVNPMVLNADDFLLAGHGRRKGLIAMKSGGDAPPKNIEAEGDEWIVPVGIGSKFNKREATAYRLVDNRSTEQGGYDEPQLLENLMELSKNGGLEGTGYDNEDVDRLFQLLNPDLEEVAVSDEAKKLQRKWKTKLGQLWEIGKHRLLCGDASSAEDVALLVDETKAQIVFTDPPYGIGKEIKNDALEGPDFDVFNNSWIRQLLVDENAMMVSYHSTRTFPSVLNAASDNGWAFERMLWFHRPDKFPVHTWKGWVLCSQAIMLFSRGTPSFQSVSPADQDFYRCTSLDLGEHSGHPTEKIVSQCVDVITHLGGKVIVDPFLGSGTTMVAAEQLNRTCYGMEIEPKYVAVTLERMSTMGLEPELISGA